MPLPFHRVLRLFPAPLFRRIAADARSRAGLAAPFHHVQGERRPGTPGFWIETTEGGGVFARAVAAPSTLEALRRATGRRWLPRRRGGSYIYYRRTSQSFGLHRDRRQCGLAVITCLADRPGRGGDLVLYPRRAGESLAAILASPRRGAFRIRLKPGESLLLDGRRIAHRVTRLGRGRLRITAATCYYAAR